MMVAVGQPIKRLVDPRLLRGHGRYVADIHRPGMLHAAFVRSVHAHAEIIGVDISRARRLAGVVAIWTPNEVAFSPLPLLFAHPKLDPVTQTPLGHVVHHVGEPIAVVVANSRYQAEDAIAAITVEYRVLSGVAFLREALAKDAPRVHSDRPHNLAGEFEQRVGDAQTALKEAPVVVHDHFEVGRISCMPMETRGLIAEWDQGLDKRLTVWAATQTPHMMRHIYSQYFVLEEADIRVVAPDVGGAFGAKEPFYVEDLVVAWAARELSRPLVWIEDRMEHLSSAVHEREQIHESAMGLTRDGRILAVYDQFLAGTGAYVPWGIIVPIITSTLIPGVFQVPHYLCQAKVAYTNTTPLAPYRGAGRPQAAMVINRLLDAAALKLGLDPVEIRRRNFIPTDGFPYETGLVSREGSPMVIDSGDYPGLWQTLVQEGQYADWRQRQKMLDEDDRTIGIGVAMALENTGMGPFEGAVVGVKEDGTVTVATGAASQGQGHETSLAQIVADVLGVQIESVRVHEGDTGQVPMGTGTFASRTAAIAGSAAHGASLLVKQKILAMAGQLLEASTDDLDLKDGCVTVKGVPEKSLALGDLAFMAKGPFPGSTFTWPIEPGLSATHYFVPPGAVYSASAHLVVVEVYKHTGQIKILHYVSVHDCGREINPLIVKGQIVGGVVAGIGTALYEEVLYDHEGQLLTNSLMDYLIPGAVEMPDVISLSHGTPTPLNPLGVKGVGESGAIPAPQAVSAAVQDAIRGWGITVSRVPVRSRDVYIPSSGP